MDSYTHSLLPERLEVIEVGRRRRWSAPVLPVPPRPTPLRPSGLIEIELFHGRRLRVSADVDGDALGRVLDVLERR